MKNIIVLPHGCIKKLAQTFNCSRYTVSDALRTDKKGVKKDQIRKYVSEKYAKKAWRVKS